MEDFSMLNAKEESFELASGSQFTLNLDHNNGNEQTEGLTLESDQNFLHVEQKETDSDSSEHSEESAHMRSLRKMVSCALCKRVLKTAHCFAKCFHAFCGECIEKILPDGDAHTFVCPVCAMPTGKDDVRSDPLMTKLIDIYWKIRGGRFPCTQCSDVSKYRCVECKQDYCEQCKQTHTELPVCRGHSFTGCTGMTSCTQLIDLVTFCEIHPDSQVEFNCEQCERPICHKCFVLDHRHVTCNIEDIDVANERLAPVVDGYLELLAEQKTHMDGMIAYNADMSATITENASEQKKRIQLVIDSLIMRIQEEGKSLMLESECAMNEQLKPVHAQKEEAQACSDRLQSVTEWTRCVMDNTTGSARLMELQTKLLPQLKSIVKNPTQIGIFETKAIKFEENELLHDNSPLVGQIVVGTPQKDAMQAATPEDIVEATFRVTHCSSSDEEEWLETRSSTPDIFANQQVSVSKVTSKIETLPRDVQPFVSSYVPNSFLELLRKDITTEKHFFINRFCYQFCIANDYLWLPCHLDDNIDVYSLEGDYITHIIPESMNGVRAIRALEDGRFVAACANGLFLADETFMNPDCIHRGSFADVTTYNGRLFALDCAQNRVTVFTRETYGWFLTNFTIDGIVFDAYDRIRVRNDQVFVSSATHHTIAVTDTQGKLIRYFKSHGDQASKLAYLCGVSDEKELLVVDNTNSTVQVLGEDEQWHMWESLKVQGPHDVVFQDEQTMWLLCSDSVKRTQIHRFTLL